ncbi:MAG: hypothetical protein IJF39_04865 [Clostridia bacterium]|nr:hypothetical protein [Clostridia bacterium]
MQGYFANRSVAERCHILKMLEAQAKAEHYSYHTPGHKRKGYDITELGYSDNLACPRGVILSAQQDIAEILGADASYLLTDGSTAGVLSMLYALKSLGCRTVSAFTASHKSFFSGCLLTGLQPVLLETPMGANGLPRKICGEDVLEGVEGADALFLTSPDYYGNVADLKAIQAMCKKHGKYLVVDGAHGGHLHYNCALYAGAYADMWVDGVHKSLPALTQGAVVSAQKPCVEALCAAVDIFRTTSPSYPIMASVEYAVKYPQNAWLEGFVHGLKKEKPYLYAGEDYTKLCVFAADGFAMEQAAIAEGIYPEFATEQLVCFYLSPAQGKEEIDRLVAFLERANEQGLLLAEKDVHSNPAPVEICQTEGYETEKTPLLEAEGRIAARVCGLFPPCLPLIRKGERITAEKIQALEKGANVFGVENGKILVHKDL